MKKILYATLAISLTLAMTTACNDDNSVAEEMEPDIAAEDTTEQAEAEDSVWMSNPIVYADLPDPSIVRVGDDYYMVSTTMHFSPSVVVLHSKDMVAWEIIGHVDKDNVGECPAASLEKCTVSTVRGHSHNHVYEDEAGNYRDDIYAQGSWASSLAYHDGYFYCLWNLIQDDESFISRTQDPAGDWEVVSECNPIFYDSSLFFDDDGTAYIARAHSEKIFQLDSNLDLNTATEIYDFSDDRGQYNDTEGYHMFKMQGYYYISMVMWISTPSVVMMRSENVDGPYVPRLALEGAVVDESGEWVSTSGVAQGRIIDTPDELNPRYYGFFAASMGMAGRSPVIADITFTPRQMPIFGNGGTSVNEKMTAPIQKYGMIGESRVASSDDFSSLELDPVWEWNHNPDNSAWSLSARSGYLRLSAEHIATDFFHGRNTLTQRTVGPRCSGEVVMDVSHMQEGDRAGIGMMQYRSGNVGVKKEDGKYYVFMSKGIQNYGKYSASDLNDGDYFGAMKDFASEEVTTDGGRVRLRVEADFKTNRATFYYQHDGAWEQVGEEMTMTYDLYNFTGNRFAIFNYATEVTGGYVDVDSFTFENE